MLKTMGTTYRPEALNMLKDGYLLLPPSFNNSNDATIILHPPGYTILWAGIMRLFGDSDTAIQIVQIIGDATAAVLILLIASELLPFTVAIISGLLVAMSPHLSYYSLWLSPDSLAVLPVLTAIFFIIRAVKKPRLISVILAGVFLDLSCWLRSNALLLGPAVGVLALILFAHGRRFRYGLAILGAMLITISPITIRNYILCHRVVPLSLGAGITLIEGIADYDKERRFGMPFTDEEAASQEAAAPHRPDYENDLWIVDGIERDRMRFARGLSVIRAHPLWFFKVMIRRAGFMLRYNDAGAQDWPFYSANVPLVAAEPLVRPPLSLGAAQALWSTSAADLLANGEAASSQTKLAMTGDGKALQIESNEYGYADQFASQPFGVKRHTDYVLRVSASLEQGNVAAKITTPDRRVTIASAILATEEKKTRKRVKKEAATVSDADIADASTDSDLAAILIPFASSDRDEVCLVLSNNQPGLADSRLRVGGMEMFELGPTAYAWTQYPRVIIHAAQRNLFKTSRMLPLVIIGIALLSLTRRKRELAILLIVPVYYMSVQSALHTEYRYILAIHYFLFIMAAISIYVVAHLLNHGLRQASQWTKARRLS
jgi:hypothetical protein